MKSKEYLSYLLTFDGKNYYLDPKNEKVYTETYKQELGIDLTMFVPVANIFLLNTASYILDRQSSLLFKLLLLFLGIAASAYLAEMLVRKEKSEAFKEFDFKTMFRKEEFLIILSRNVYGKMWAGLIFAGFAIYQIRVYLSGGNFVSYLLTMMSAFLVYPSFVQSHLVKQMKLLRKFRNDG